jgi:hypothetical protein
MVSDVSVYHDVRMWWSKAVQLMAVRKYTEDRMIWPTKVHLPVTSFLEQGPGPAFHSFYYLPIVHSNFESISGLNH